ncbi:MAG: pyridoxal-dependent decarboxylase [Bacteroidia bacterium]
MGHRLIDWMAAYLEGIEERPVRAQVQPGDILRQLPAAAPIAGESIETIFGDFEQLIMPGMTQWQSPRFFAYFPASTSYPSLLAEMLTATLGAQCMVWETSPAAAELEQRMMEWLGALIGIPPDWEGVIQSTASDATLVALLTARERATGYDINRRGYDGERYRVYCSEQAHSSVEKGVKIAGIGQENCVKIAVDDAYAMQPAALRAAIEADLAAGLRPLCIVAALGTTSSTAIDPLAELATIAQTYGLWLHVDAAYAGSALILPEYRGLMEGIALADSFVFNPHKWLFTHFDCSAYFVRDRAALVRTFEILPEYLKTRAGRQVNDYRDWGIPLGRRFRALKLWFVLRSFGVAGLQEKLRHHMDLARDLARQIDEHPAFERMAPVPFNLICFRCHPPGQDDPAYLDQLNEEIIRQVNDSGSYYLTHTRLRGAYVLRLVPGHERVEARHVTGAWEMICEVADRLVQQALR